MDAEILFEDIEMLIENRMEILLKGNTPESEKERHARFDELTQLLTQIKDLRKEAPKET